MVMLVNATHVLLTRRVVVVLQSSQWYDDRYRPPELLLGNEVYGPEVDIWSTGCILGELYNRRPIFRADNEIDQLDAISRVCGTPTPAAWPTVHQCRLFDTMQFKKVYPRQVKEHFRQNFPAFPPDGVDLLDQLLILDPSKRITSAKALQVRMLSLFSRLQCDGMVAWCSMNRQQTHAIPHYTCSQPINSHPHMICLSLSAHTILDMSLACVLA